MSVARYCPFCAAGAEPDWAFCQACGKRLPGAAAGAMDERDRAVAEAWQRAMRHMEMGDLDDAELAAGRLADLGCDAGDLAALSGSIALRRARIEEALELLDEALQKSPHSPYVHIKRAEYWKTLGMSQKAIDELQEGLRVAESERVRDELRKMLEKLKKDSRWNFARASPFGKK